MMCFRPDVIKRNYAFDIDEYAMKGISRPAEIKNPVPPPAAETIIPVDIEEARIMDEVPVVVKEQSIKKVTAKKSKGKRWFPEMKIPFSGEDDFKLRAVGNLTHTNPANIHSSHKNAMPFCRGGPS